MALRQGNKNTLVKKWQQFLIQQGFLNDIADGDFGPKSFKATKDFQKFHKLGSDGIVGSLTFGKAYELGFNPEGEPPPNPVLKGDKGMMLWIKNNLGSIIKEAVKNSQYTEDWLAGICARETGFLFMRYHNQGMSFDEISIRMKGDYGRRAGESQKQYHGYGYWQMDTGSYPGFINSGDWKDPLKTAKMAVKVLDEKRKYLKQKGWDERLSDEMFERAITAAFNCGQGNVNKALSNGSDVDRYTFSNDYSREVFRYRNIYKNL